MRRKDFLLHYVFPPKTLCPSVRLVALYRIQCSRATLIRGDSPPIPTTRAPGYFPLMSCLRIVPIDIAKPLTSTTAFPLASLWWCCGFVAYDVVQARANHLAHGLGEAVRKCRWWVSKCTPCSAATVTQHIHIAHCATAVLHTLVQCW